MVSAPPREQLTAPGDNYNYETESRYIYITKKKKSLSYSPSLDGSLLIHAGVVSIHVYLNILWNKLQVRPHIWNGLQNRLPQRTIYESKSERKDERQTKFLSKSRT